ncbi:MAG: DUF1634 domain-containing protein [Thermoplasmata archaeon]|uniref:DUF1634 domain-containing protein n=1 Tax=Candidatus Sysuiplasma superficiale TaxID=2823368 RepID=A0A8J7YS85_9ARCH|nr:DUF1634 domain-containing protein [Candidatus Sysuiplasma superficiale]MCL4347242.1 DUF1634 domain-containing protein [Candidatus Thermoplasmatota archaeon]MCL5437411.1 DUF1634 domain-containing protein [Candidatus Thermoplasmatota archaeon]
MRDIEDWISYSLITGVIISIVLISAGVILLFIQGGIPGIPLYGVANVHSNVNTMTYNFFEAYSHFSGVTLIYTGLVVLIFTPISRVILLIGKFAAVRDRLYLVLSIIVLVNLFIAIIIIPHM